MSNFWAKRDFAVNGKKVQVLFLFGKSKMFGSPRFRERDVKKAWKDFLKFLAKRRDENEKDEEPKIYDYLRKYIPYFAQSEHVPTIDFFKGIVESVMTESLKSFIHESPYIIAEKFIVIQIKIVKTGRDELYPDWYGALMAPYCTPTNAYIELSGEYLMDNVVGPYFMIQVLKSKELVDNPTIIDHELQHFIGIKSVRFYDIIFDEKWKEVSNAASQRYSKIPKRSPETILLIATAYGIEAEALPTFRERNKLKEIPINPRFIGEFKSKLEKLSEKEDSKKARNYFDNKIDMADFEGGGTYFCALLMSVTIALSIAKKLNKWEIFLRRGEESYHFSAFNELLDGNKRFYVPKLPQDLFNITLDYIYENTYVFRDKEGTIRTDDKGKPTGASPILRFKKLIKLYEQACDVLDIKEGRRVLTWSSFYNLYRQSRIRYKEKYKKLVEEAGFVYVDLGMDYY